MTPLFAPGGLGQRPRVDKLAARLLLSWEEAVVFADDWETRDSTRRWARRLPCVADATVPGCILLPQVGRRELFGRVVLDAHPPRDSRPGSDNGKGTVDYDGLILDGWRPLPSPA